MVWGGETQEGGDIFLHIADSHCLCGKREQTNAKQLYSNKNKQTKS